MSQDNKDGKRVDISGMPSVNTTLNGILNKRYDDPNPKDMMPRYFEVQETLGFKEVYSGFGWQVEGNPSTVTLPEVFEYIGDKYDLLALELADLRTQSEHRYDWAMAQQKRADERGVEIENLSTEITRLRAKCDAKKQLIADQPKAFTLLSKAETERDIYKAALTEITADVDTREHSRGSLVAHYSNIAFEALEKGCGE